MSLAGNLIRARREAKSWSLGNMAERIGVTSSFLSLVENGKRQLSEKQATDIALLLGIPTELLLLGSGRLPDDVVGAIRFDAANAAAAIRQSTEKGVVDFPTSPRVIIQNQGGESKASSLVGAIPTRVTVSKTSASYRAHSYHTKVPPAAITPFIQCLTDSNGVVADPFCGSGMTGVAALQQGRSAYLSDLSPAAVHIARNYATPCDPKSLRSALSRVEENVSTTMAWLYRPTGPDHRNIEYTTWSDLFQCPHCGEDLLYWDVRDANDGRDVRCISCGRASRKSEFRWKGEVPVETHVASGSNRIETRAADSFDRALIEEVSSVPIPYWTPSADFGPDREMWRASHAAMGITDAAHFFTRRNLYALAALRHAIFKCSEGRVRDALMFAFTASVNRASRRYQWNAKRPTNVMTGTLYISSLRYEWNVWSLFRRKALDVLRYYDSFPTNDATVEVFQRTATDLSCLPDGSVDLVFMDPPFGSNIFYADSSILWEAWLGTLTARSSEMVVSTDRKRVTSAKDLSEYGDLMRQSFCEVRRILRKRGQSVLAFSNSDDAVWESVQDALSDAGLGVAAIHVLDKGQPSIKGVKGLLGKENVTRLDLMLRLEKINPRSDKLRKTASDEFLDKEIERALQDQAEPTDTVYSMVLRAALSKGLSARGITMPSIATRCLNLGAKKVDGKWVLPQPRKESSPADFVEGYLADSTTIPVTTTKECPEYTPKTLKPIAGGRGSPAYLAHSYHTKVPPEAIVPYIENFSRPGDVVLDPFCGSGMTGVAANQTGRRAILSDLSPVAAHLAWNHTRACDPNELVIAFAALEERLRGKIDQIYATTDENGNKARSHWVLWSTVHQCPGCSLEFSLWSVVDRESGRLGRSMTCPKCGLTKERRQFVVVDNAPAWISFERPDGSRGERPANDKDVKRARSFQRRDIPAWWPDVPLGADREMYQRCALHLQKIETVADLYTPRNLHALALIWQQIQAEPNVRLRRALAFAFTNTAWHGTRMRRFNARGGQRPLTGTLYVPQLSSEANVLEVMRNKIAQLAKFYATVPTIEHPPAVLQGSATELAQIKTESVDYIFTDPPFGSNIFYADCNLIWESWLGRTTDTSLEAVINRSLPKSSGGKDLATYQELMSGAMREMARVLKPGGWATVVFHNTDPAVWEAIRVAATSANLEFHEAASLDRKQQSHKGYKGRQGTENVAHFDVVMNLQKPSALAGGGKRRPRSKNQALSLTLAQEIQIVLKDQKIASRGVQGVHAEIMRRRASTDKASFVSFADVRAAFAEVSDPQLKRKEKS